MNFNYLSLVLAALLSFAWPAAASAQNSVPLKLNHTDSPSSARHRAAELFAERVAQYTQGRYRVLVFHSGQLGNDPQSVAAVQKGELDFTTSSVGTFAAQHKPLNLTMMPYLVENYEQGWRLYDQSKWMRTQFDALADKGVRVISMWEAGFRSFTTREELRDPADAKGRKMRVFPNDMVKWTMEAIGFETVVLPVTDVYLAIQQGRVIGQENPVDTIASLRFYEVAPHLTLTRHIYSPSPLVISGKTWDRLSPADREAVGRAAVESGAFNRRAVADNDQKVISELAARGAKVTQPPTAPFRKAVEPVYAKARALYGQDADALLAEAEAIRGRQLARATP